MNDNVSPVSGFWLIMCLVTVGMAFYAVLIDGEVTTGIALLALALGCRNALAISVIKKGGGDD